MAQQIRSFLAGSLAAAHKCFACLCIAGRYRTTLVHCGQRWRPSLTLFTTSIQVTHLMRLAAEMDLKENVRQAFAQILVGSVGPMTSEELRENRLTVGFEPAHPKMGSLVNEAAKSRRRIAKAKARPFVEVSPR
jgi:hypothetical protein